MNRNEIREQVLRNLTEADIATDETDIRVQADPYGGWNIAVISPAFDKLSAEDRRSRTLRGLADEEIEWAELLTPSEVEWAGPLPGDVEPEELPLWAESLARSRMTGREDSVLPSDLDDDIEPPIVATFYSLRGGVGRSTALAYAARILEANRHKVVCVDMDLEAPSLPVLLGCDDDIREDRGVVDILMALDQGAQVDFASHLVPAANAENLFVLPAGRVSADYARKLRFINPAAWYREHRNPLRELLAGLREKLPFRPDVVLLDARTGITDLSGPLLFDLADIAVVVFFPHPQARQGTELLAQSLLSTVTGRSVRGQDGVLPELRFLISPLPASKSREVVQRYERRPLEWIGKWFQDFNDRREQKGLMPIDPEEISHFVRYREDIATSDKVGSDSEIWRAFQPVADWVERFIASAVELSTGASTSDLKPRVLEELSFSAGTAEQQKELLKDFVQTDNVREAASPNVPLVLGRKGTGKTALFRYLSESQSSNAVIVHAPRAIAGDRAWMLSADGFKEVDSTINTTEMEWRHFWMLYAAAALEQVMGGAVQRPEHLQAAGLSSQTEIIDALVSTASTPRGSLLLGEWLRRFDMTATAETMLLLDGLDTGFGSSPEERRRRTRSIEGLFGAWMDLGQGLTNLRFKILLRDDIWRQLDFDNKSHLYGRSVRLEWSSQSAFLKVAIKQAMRSASFKEHEVLLRLKQVSVDDWPDESLRRAWDVLVGERMKGGQTTYTRNWVWNRLADANDDHSPRYLLQLFHEAVPWEQAEEEKSPYGKTFIRPRALVRCLPKVSEEALGALSEEFDELKPLLDLLKQVGRTPVLATAIAEKKELVPLAREVGLLAVYEESGDEVVRYKVPDLYRYGLGMTRKGQA